MKSPWASRFLVIDGRPDPLTGVSPTEDHRIFGLLEFAVNVIEDTDNSLGRPIFLVPVDFSTTTAVSSQANTISFTRTEHDLARFEISYPQGAARFGDGTSTGNLTANAH